MSATTVAKRTMMIDRALLVELRPTAVLCLISKEKRRGCGNPSPWHRPR